MQLVALNVEVNFAVLYSLSSWSSFAQDTTVFKSVCFVDIQLSGMTSAQVTRGRPTSISSIASADSYQVLSDVGDDWEALSAAPSETGATVLSEDDESYSPAKGAERESVEPGVIAPASRGNLLTSQHKGISPDNTMLESSGFSSGAPMDHSVKASDAMDPYEQQARLFQSEAALTRPDLHEPSAHIPVLASSAPNSVHDRSSSQSITLLSSSPPGFSQPLDSVARSSTEPPQPHPTIPPREQRIWMHTGRALPASIVATAPFVDADGSPLMVGSALIDGEVHPCKITLSRLGDAGFTPVRLAYRGKEIVHNGVYEVLVVDEDTMEWVGARNGKLPRGRAPVEGGYDREGRRLYYAVTTIQGFRVPGETSEHDVRFYISLFRPSSS